jgi:MFS family permease
LGKSENAVMSLTTKEFWTALHGMMFGAGFLLAFAGGLAGLWSLRPEWVTAEGYKSSLRRIIIGTWLMTVLAWAAVLIGTYVIYPWYRVPPPPNASHVPIQEYPRSYLLSSARTADWHNFGMEWKEHVAWFAPVLATAVAYVVTRQRQALLHDANLRRMLMFLFTASFFCAAIAGLFGALINKAAPLR